MGLSVDRPTTRVPADPPPPPALVVTFGSTQNKHRPLTKAANLIGRNRSCDIRLDAPEISGIHCIIARDEHGLSIRDCDSKSGVIVNGQPVREAELRDGDAIQLGPFSFVASIPARLPQASACSAGESNHSAHPDLENELKCLRNHIAGVEAERDKLAGQFRDATSEIDRLREQSPQPGPDSNHEVAERDRLIAEVSADRDRWKSVAEEAQRSLAQAQATSNDSGNQSSWLEEEVERIAQERNRLKADLEAAEFSRQEAEKKHRESDRALADLQQQAGEWESQRRQLADERDAARAELEPLRLAVQESKNHIEDHSRQHSGTMDELHRRVEQLTAELEESARHRATLEAQLDELQGMKTETSDAGVSELQQSIEKIQRERDALAEDLRYWQSQAEESARKLSEAEGSAGSGHASEDLSNARQEIETLRQQVQEEADQADQRLAAMRGELDRERAQMKQLVMQAAADHDRTQAELDRLREEHELHQQVWQANPDDIHAELLQLRQRVAELGGASSPDLQSYEDQLNQYRGELESAQAELQARQEQLERENSELLEKLKQSELDLSRDRAALARDRAEIERIRRELAAELRHAEREATSKSKLAPVEQLAQELKGKQASNDSAPSSFSQRLQNLIRRVEDPPT